MKPEVELSNPERQQAHDVVPIVLELRDDTRDRSFATDVYVTYVGPDRPLIVFGHGAWGSPRKFTRLFAYWIDVGYAVAAPTFPSTNEQARPHLISDVGASAQ